MPYERILAAVAGQPWAIEPAAGRQLAAILNRRMHEGKASPEGLAEAREIAAGRQKRKAKAPPGGVALIPLYGVMVQRADWFMETSGMLSTDQIGQLVDQAAADPGIEAIVMDVDSPGGSVFGTEELARKVTAAAKQKKTIAVANSMAASAAYYVASQASELVVTPGGLVGSIGVVVFHTDESEKLKMAGESVTVVGSSETKIAGADPGPLSPAGRAHLESIVSGYFDLFVKAVARGRNTTQTRVREEFGDGGMVLAEAAVKRGMADRVGMLDDVLGRYGLSTADVSPAAESARPDVEFRRRRMQLG